VESPRFLWADEHGIFYYIPKIEGNEYSIELGVALRVIEPDPSDQRRGKWMILIPFKAEVVADVKVDVIFKSDYSQHIPSSMTLELSLYDLVPHEIAKQYKEKTNESLIRVAITRDEILSSLFSMDTPHSLYHRILEKLSDLETLTQGWKRGFATIWESEDLTLNYLQKLLPVFRRVTESRVGRRGKVAVLVNADFEGKFFSDRDLLINVRPQIEGGDVYLTCYAETEYRFPIYFWVAVPTNILREGNFREILPELVVTTFETIPEVSIDVSDVMLESLKETLESLVHKAMRESFERTTSPGWSIVKQVERKLDEELGRKFQEVGIHWDRKMLNRSEIYQEAKKQIISEVYMSIFVSKLDLIKGSCKTVNRIERVEVSDLDPKISLLRSSSKSPPDTSSEYMFDLSGESVRYSHEINRYTETIDVTLRFSFGDENTFRSVTRTLETISERSTDFDGFIRTFWMFYNLLLKGHLDTSGMGGFVLDWFERVIQGYLT